MSAPIPAWVDGTLRPVDKLKVHLDGLKHPAVSVFVLQAGRVLIQRRALSKYHTPGLWANTCCTHPHWGEAPAACARRRLREELGIDGLSPVHRQQAEYRADVGGGMTEHEVVDIYLAETDDDLALTPHPAEVAAVRWVELPALAAEVARHPDRFTPWLRIYLDRHAKAVFGAPARR